MLTINYAHNAHKISDLYFWSVALHPLLLCSSNWPVCYLVSFQSRFFHFYTVKRYCAGAYGLASNLYGLTCIPLVAETLGGLAEDFISTIRDIGRSIGLRSGAEGDKTTTKHLFGRVSIALWRGNASMLIHRSPTSTLSPALDGTHLDIYFLNKINYYFSLVCALPTCLYFTCFTVRGGWTRVILCNDKIMW